MPDTQPGIAPTEIAEKLAALRELRDAPPEGEYESGLDYGIDSAIPIIEAQQGLLREARDVLQRIMALPKLKDVPPPGQAALYMMPTTGIEETLSRITASLEPTDDR